MRLYIAIIFIIIVTLANVITYIQTKSQLKKYGDILDKESEDQLERKKYPNGEYDDALQILRDLHKSRIKAFEDYGVYKSIGFLRNVIYGSKNKKN